MPDRRDPGQAQGKVPEWLKFLVTVLVASIPAVGSLFVMWDDIRDNERAIATWNAEQKEDISELSDDITKLSTVISSREVDNSQWTSIRVLEQKVAALVRDQARFNDLSNPREIQQWGVIKDQWPMVSSRSSKNAIAITQVQYLIAALNNQDAEVNKVLDELDRKVDLLLRRANP